MNQAETLTPLLAGTQCTQCGYPSCAAYAHALATQHAPTNLCLPGGPRVESALNTALNHTPQNAPRTTQNGLPTLALVREEDCIGCTLCAQKCPTSAIVGATKQVHTVLPELCTGCNLCLPVCPVDCIIPTPAPATHKLTQQLPDGSLALAASAAIWNLVNATAARKAAPRQRGTKTTPAAPHTELSALSPDLLAKINAARQKSAAKFAAKGPLRTPTALKKS